MPWWLSSQRQGWTIADLSRVSSGAAAVPVTCFQVPSWRRLWHLEPFPCLLHAPKSRPGWVDFRLLRFGFPKPVLTPPCTQLIRSFCGSRLTSCTPAIQVKCCQTALALGLRFSGFGAVPEGSESLTQACRTWMSFRWERQLYDSLISSSG